MTIVYETQTFQVDPNAAPTQGNGLAKGFNVLEVAIITNTVKANGVREITLGIVYDDANDVSHFISFETITVGNSIDDVTDEEMNVSSSIQFVEFIDHTIRNDTVSVTIMTISTSVGQTNRFNTQKFQFDPSSPITTGITVPTTRTFVESHLVNVGSLVKTSSVASGTINAVAIFVTTP